MTTRDTEIIRKTENFVETSIDSEVVLLNLESGGFYSLKATGRRVWELLAEYPTIRALTDKLLEEYDVDREQCRADISDLIDQFLESNMLEINVQ